VLGSILETELCLELEMAPGWALDSILETVLLGSILETELCFELETVLGSAPDSILDMVLLGLVQGLELGLETAMGLETRLGSELETALDWVLGLILESLEPEMALDWAHRTMTKPGLELETWLGTTNAKQQTRRPTLMTRTQMKTTWTYLPNRTGS
jgi:hypothetical protein